MKLILPSKGQTVKQVQLKLRKELSAFMDHCCVRRRYFICIKKCGGQECQFCKPPRLPPDVFEKLNVFPDPIKKADSDSYEDFCDIFGKTTSEKDRPSLSQSRKKKSKENKPTKPFRMTCETVYGVLICGDCLKPRCLYSKRKLIRSEQIELTHCKEEYMYTCGGQYFLREVICSLYVAQNYCRPVKSW